VAAEGVLNAIHLNAGVVHAHAAPVYGYREREREGV